MAFPVLSINPLVEPFDNSLNDENTTVESPKEAGYVQTRPRFTRNTERWHISYSGLTSADRTALRAHEVAVKIKADSFSWTDPLTAVSHTVRYKAAIKYKPENKFDDTGAHTWSAEFDLEEV